MVLLVPCCEGGERGHRCPYKRCHPQALPSCPMEAALPALYPTPITKKPWISCINITFKIMIDIIIITSFLIVSLSSLSAPLHCCCHYISIAIPVHFSWLLSSFFGRFYHHHHHHHHAHWDYYCWYSSLFSLSLTAVTIILSLPTHGIGNIPLSSFSLNPAVTILLPLLTRDSENNPLLVLAATIILSHTHNCSKDKSLSSLSLACGRRINSTKDDRR